MSLIGEISTKEHYGLRLALRLAKSYYTKAPVSLADVSDKEKISMKYLEQLVLPFKKTGWIKSLRGREGGYLMTKDPAKISLKDFIYLYSTEKYLVECLKKGCKCSLNANCMSKSAWAKIQKSLLQALNGITIKELLTN